MQRSDSAGYYLHVGPLVTDLCARWWVFRPSDRCCDGAQCGRSYVTGMWECEEYEL